MDYKKLFKDKLEGKISNEMIIIFDNDSGYWGCSNKDENINESMCNEYEQRYGRPNGYYDVVDIMTGAGFKADWC